MSKCPYEDIHSRRRTTSKTINNNQDEKLKNFLDKYEQEKYVVAGKELGKNVRDVQKRAKELRLV